ncbi:hypothetical protein EJB05_03688 [Eragrostis curvula]|uniref:ABC transporter domain-containing protein n=1 Tax=Eragrostis curvula TaxID=38414 RepID=A0A5J9W6C5_9POAL|nr:hypothetical protein EJB05_03688 [Eragrostis curvula]
MEASSEQYRSSSSSASSPAARRYYLPKAGRPIAFEDSPDWDDIHLDDPVVHLSASSINSSAYPSPARSLPPASASDCRMPGEEGGRSYPGLEGAHRLRQGRPPHHPPRRQELHRLRAAGHAHRHHGPRSLRQIHAAPSNRRKNKWSSLLTAAHLLNSSGRLTAAERMYGEVFVNGAKSRLPYGSYGYVDRDDVLINSLTVREMLYFSALLQLPGFLASKKSIVEDAIAAMSLGDHADKLIGGHFFTKRLPIGERRRVSIARELVMRPHALFIDEPLYNLDSVSALLLMVTLKKLASTGCTVIFTMYQSSTEVFGLFDRICLLSNGNTLFFGETLACLQHFSNAGFPCPIMQSPSDHFLRAINTDFDRIIAMCKNLQDDQGDFSSVSMDTAVAIRTLEATYKQSADSVAVESMIAKLTEKVRVSAIFAFVSSVILLSVSGVPAHIDEIKIYSHEETNRHCGTMVFLLGHFLSSIPFLFLVSISSSLVFYFLIGLRNEFSFLMYFVVTIFMCLLANEALMMIVAYMWPESYECTLTLICLYVIMMLVAGYFRTRESLPYPVWTYPLSFISFHAYVVQGLLENEYVGTSFAVGQIRTIPGVQAVRGSYDISSSSNAKWVNLLALLLMAIGYRILLYILLRLNVRKLARFGNWRSCCPSVHTASVK